MLNLLIVDWFGFVLSTSSQYELLKVARYLISRFVTTADLRLILAAGEILHKFRIFLIQTCVIMSWTRKLHLCCAVLGDFMGFDVFILSR